MIDYDSESGMHVYKPGTEGRSFEITTMIEEWRDVLSWDTPKMDPALVALLTAKQAERFDRHVMFECHLKWRQLDGTFEVWGLVDGRVPTPEMLDEIWSDTFDEVQCMLGDIEEDVLDERALGLID